MEDRLVLSSALPLFPPQPVHVVVALQPPEPIISQVPRFLPPETWISQGLRFFPPEPI